MKALTSKTLLPVSRLSLGLLLAACLLPSTIQATDLIWDNSGTVNSAPQIDALNFVNSGTLDFFSSLPFETANTLNYTNSGTMVSSPGWFFDVGTANTGVRHASDNFVNLNGGLVQSLDGGGFFIIGTGGVLIGGAGSLSSFLWIDATNVVNKGTLSVGGNGWLKITGTNVNVARGALEVTPIQASGSTTIGGTNFLNDVGIKDIYWGQTNGLIFNSAAVYNGTRATAPPHFVQTEFGAGFTSFSVNQPFTFGYSNVTDFVPLTITNIDGSTTAITVPSNIIKQAVFVGISDPSIMSAAVSFFPSTTFTNPFQTVCVQLALISTNVISGVLESTPLYFYDTLASETNRGLQVNIGGQALPPFVTQRPANYDISRVDDGRFASGSPPNVSPESTFLYDPDTFTNRVVTGEYAGYEVSVDNLASEPPPTTPGTVTNFPGRVQVYADSLDLRSTRIRAEGEVIVKATHLLSSAGAAVDCENLSYTLGSTNGLLNVTGLSKQSVIRLKGNMFAWSGLWSNQMVVLITNNYTVTNILDTNGVIIGTNAVPSPLTNTISVGLHALILDATRLAARIPVITWDLVTHSTNIVISDSLSVVQSLFLDGTSLTINGNLALTSSTLQNNFGQAVTTELTDWVYTNAPDLLYFTNRGTLTVPSEGHFGDDRPVPYSDFVVTGTLQGGSLDINSTYIENDGSLSTTVGPLNLVGTTGKFQGGQTSSSENLNLQFADAKFFNHRISTVGSLNLDVTDSLSDAGAGSGNTFTLRNGFNLLAKPNTGDLLGTTFQDTPPNFVEVDHVWAGQDRGANASGFRDNAAIGKLILTVQSSNPLQIPLFRFSGTNGQSGLYVDQLDLSSLGSNYVAMLQIDPNITIYYASAKLGFTPPVNSSGIPQEPEEFLNGQFGGHLVWVSGFTGPNSSTAVLVNGQTILMNTALRNSKIIDSDGDGIPNFFDSTPLGGSGGGGPAGLVLGNGFFNRVSSSQQAFSLSWNALGNTAYRVEMTTDLAHPSWQLVTTYNNTSPTTANVTISDTNNVTIGQRFYRVRVAP